MISRVLRFGSTDDLVQTAAQRLAERLVSLQADQDMVHLCLTGGRVANRVYEAFAEYVPDSGLDPAKLTLWWGDERFVGLTDSARQGLEALSLLARTLTLIPSQTHAMPARDGRADPHDAAYAYAHELGETRFDLCLLGMGEDGHVASLFPGDTRIDSRSSTVIGVTDAPKPPAERISVTLPVINRSQAVWLFVSGAEKAAAVGRALSGDETIPAGRVAGTHETLWFLDEAAAEHLPRYHCLV